MVVCLEESPIWTTLQELSAEAVKSEDAERGKNVQQAQESISNFLSVFPKGTPNQEEIAAAICNTKGYVPTGGPEEESYANFVHELIVTGSCRQMEDDEPLVAGILISDALAIYKKLMQSSPATYFKQLLELTMSLGSAYVGTNSTNLAKTCYIPLVGLAVMEATTFNNHFEGLNKEDHEEAIARCSARAAVRLASMFREEGNMEELSFALDVSKKFYKKVLSDLSAVELMRLPPTKLTELLYDIVTLADIYSAESRTEDAKYAIEAANELLTMLIHLQRGGYELPDLYWLAASMAYQRMGEYCALEEQWSAAEDHFKNAVKFSTTLHQRYPNNTKYTDHQAEITNELGIVLASSGRIVDAQLQLYEAVGLRRKLAKVHVRYLPALGACLNNTGTVLRKTHNNKTAQILLEEALAVFERLEDAEPGMFTGIKDSVVKNMQGAKEKAATSSQNLMN